MIFFKILAHPVYKMRTMQEPNALELWNKLHFEEKVSKAILLISATEVFSREYINTSNWNKNT